SVLPTILTPVLGVLVLLGAIATVRGGRVWVGVAALLPPLAAMAASSLGRYPLTPRLLLFASPGIALLFGVGLHDLSARLCRSLSSIRPRHIAAGFLLPFVIVGSSALAAGEPATESMRAALRDVQLRADPGAPLYVFARNLPA